MRFLCAPLYESYRVEAEDSGVCFISIAQATESDMSQRRSMIPKNGAPASDRELMRKEVYLVLSSVSGVVSGADEIFVSAEGPCGVRVRYAMSENDFEKAWNSLPSKICEKIHECVRELNFHWYDTDRLLKHIDDLKTSVYAWYDFEDRLAEDPERTRVEEEMGLIISPDQPEPLTEYRKLERFQFAHLVYSGGLHAQPHIFMLEMKTCSELESERVSIQRKNAIARRKHEIQNKQSL